MSCFCFCIEKVTFEIKCKNDKPMKVKALFLIIFLFSASSFAGITDSTEVEVERPPITWKNGWSVGNNIGSYGIGLSVNKIISPKFNVRTSFNMFEYQQTDDELLDSVSVDGTLKLGGIPLLVDFTPKAFGSFRMTAGLMFNLTEITGDGSYMEDIHINDITLNGEDSKLVFSWEAPAITPYIGIGFGRLVPKNKLGFMVDFGAIYIGEPDLTMTSTGLLAPTAAANEEKIEDAVSDGVFWPVFNMMITYKLN